MNLWIFEINLDTVLNLIPFHDITSWREQIEKRLLCRVASSHHLCKTKVVWFSMSVCLAVYLSLYFPHCPVPLEILDRPLNSLLATIHLYDMDSEWRESFQIWNSTSHNSVWFIWCSKLPTDCEMRKSLKLPSFSPNQDLYKPFIFQNLLFMLNNKNNLSQNCFTVVFTEVGFKPRLWLHCQDLWIFRPMPYQLS